MRDVIDIGNALLAWGLTPSSVQRIIVTDIPAESSTKFVPEGPSLQVPASHQIASVD